jgi:hypothetical protein
VSPVDPTDGVSDFLVNVFSVGFGFVEVGFVDVANSSQVGDNFGGNLFVGGVLLVGGDLGLEVLGFQVPEQIVN